MNYEQSCCFTGHRPEKLPWGYNETDTRCLALKASLLAELNKAYVQGFRHFMTGMARGTDLYFCEAALLLREQHPEVTVEATIPFVGQAERWSAAERTRYQALLARCNFETVVSHSYSQGCLQRRNRYMVDHSARLIAAYHGKGGGTLYTISYAIQQELDIVIIDV